MCVYVSFSVLGGGLFIGNLIDVRGVSMKLNFYI